METNCIFSLAEAEKLAARIKEHNNATKELICELNSKHDLLEPVIITLHKENDRHQVILRCPCKTCKYEQHSIPSFLI